MAEYRNKSTNKEQILAQLNESADYPSAVDLSQRREDIGSNNWVVGGKLTASGFHTRSLSNLCPEY